MAGETDRTWGGMIQRALAHLVMGRVLLKATATADDEAVQLGWASTDRLGGGANIPGNRLWIGKTADARIVMPATSGNPPGESSYQDIAFTGYTRTYEHETPPITEALTDTYTVTENYVDSPYVRLRDDDLPSYMTADPEPQIVQERHISRLYLQATAGNVGTLLASITPGILVRLTRSSDDPVINTADDEYTFRVSHWWDPNKLTDDSYVHATRLDEMMGMIAEDDTIGGTVEMTTALWGGDMDPRQRTAAILQNCGMDGFEINVRMKRREVFKPSR